MALVAEALHHAPALASYPPTLSSQQPVDPTRSCGPNLRLLSQTSRRARLRLVVTGAVSKLALSVPELPQLTLRSSPYLSRAPSAFRQKTRLTRTGRTAPKGLPSSTEACAKRTLAPGANPDKGSLCAQPLQTLERLCKKSAMLRGDQQVVSRVFS